MIKTMAELIFNAAFNMLSIYVSIRVIRLFLKEKSGVKILSFFVYGAFWIQNYLVYYFVRQWYWVNLSFIIGAFLMSCILLKGNIGQKITAVCLAWAQGMLAEEVVWYVLKHQPQLKNNEVLGTMLSTFLFLFFMITMEFIFPFRRESKLSGWLYFHLIVVSGGSVLVGEIIIDYMGSEYNNRCLLALGILALINIAMLYMYEHLSKVYQKNIKNQVLEQQNQMYRNQFKLMQQNQLQIKMMRHDIKNHMLLLDKYLSQGDYEKAKIYMGDCVEHLNIEGEYVRSGNNEIDSILNYMIARAKQLGSDVSTEIVVPETKFMPEFDLNSLLSNLFDNALEALEKVDSRKLTISIKYNRGILCLRITNTCNGQTKQYGQIWKSSKKDEKNHGIGLQSVRSIVEKYHGNMQINKLGEIFQVDILLYTK